jgi:hypothetical protein
MQDPFGGYRDILFNMRCFETGHICEIQIHAKPLLKVKKEGGHTAYEIARRLHLFDQEQSRHEGALDDATLKVASTVSHALHAQDLDTFGLSGVCVCVRAGSGEWCY